MARTEARTEIVHDDSVLRLGVCRNLVVPAWYDAPEALHIRAMGKAILGVATRYRLDSGVLDLLVDGRPNFRDDARDELVRLMRDPRVQGKGGAHVVMVPGLAGVAARAFLSTVFLLGRSPSPNKVFADPRAAAVWLAPLLSTGREVWTPDEVVAVHAQVTRRAAGAA